MAISLKKWIGSQLFSAFMAEYNENMEAIEEELGWGVEKTATLQNGWTGTLKYRKHNGTGIVAVYGTVTSPSTKPTARQIVTTLDSGWRPRNVVTAPSYDQLVGRVQLAFKIEVSGNFACEYETVSGTQNVNASTTYNFNCLFMA